jgi:uncharacterized membrane protein
MLEIVQMVLGGAFVLFLPGFVASYAFFDKDEIDAIERVALSFGLSIAIVPLAVFYLNFLFKVPINFVNVFLTITGLCIFFFVVYRKKREISGFFGRFGKH